jgi:hypothetical protein
MIVLQTCIFHVARRTVGGMALLRLGERAVGRVAESEQRPL